MEAAADLLSRRKRVLLTSHVPPDGDGLGAGLALVRAIRARGGEAVFATAGPFQANLEFLVGPDEIDRSESGPEGSFDLAVSLDSGSFDRLGPIGPLGRECPDFLVIDHHATNERFGSVNWVEETSPATGEMVFRLLRRMEVPLTPEIALPLYVALVTDTGRFSYSNTTPAAHRMAAELLATGIDTAAATDRIYRSRPLPFLRLESLAVGALELRAEGRLACVVATPEMLALSGADEGDVGDLVDIPISVAGVEVGALLRETAPGRTKVSLRSRRWFSVSDFAARYGGGGHHRAAGAVLDRPLTEAAEPFFAELEAAIRAAADGDDR
jgi:phosphoesterase RecJ-like protein